MIWLVASVNAVFNAGVDRCVSAVCSQCLFALDVCFRSALSALSSRLAAVSPPLCQNKCKNVCESDPIPAIRRCGNVE